MLETATLLVVHATGLKRPRKEDIQVRWAHPRHKNQKRALLMEAFLSGAPAVAGLYVARAGQ